MKVFTIEKETNTIRVHGSRKRAEAINEAERFRNESGLAKLAASWPSTRLVEVWNDLPGVTVVKKFKDRSTAVARIWNAIQNLKEEAPEIAHCNAVVAEAERAMAKVTPQTLDAAPGESTTDNVAISRKQSPKAAVLKRSGGASKTDLVLALLKREGGVTTHELISVTGWQSHSVRGFLSGTVRKKMSLIVTSTKSEDGQRVYSLAV